jgi:cellulose synthase/poly-beta-1,6-N-acetylglucosamine synthase-like glycosyltransferase
VDTSASVHGPRSPNGHKSVATPEPEGGSTPVHGPGSVNGRTSSGASKSRAGRRSFDGPGATYDYARFSVLAGELTEPGDAPNYRVKFKRLGEWRPIRTWLLVLSALVFISGFFIWLMAPSHWFDHHYHGLRHVGSLVMVVNTGVIGIFTLISLWILCRASLLARDPVPVRAQEGTRVAFLTTIVPSSEPIATVRRTLEAARRIRHNGPFDIWLLDEGDDPEVRETCRALGVRHFTRRGVEQWNQPKGRFKARSKHGNYNSWLFSHGADYDYFISVDPDHVPMANIAERLLGYFRDPDVAFVVGPQVYGNYRGFVTRSAESQQFLFHSLLQRAANRGGTCMFVGTNNALRVETLIANGGFKDSVTEDLATSITIHSARNPATGRRWRSVYTPDVLAVGEGPATFTDYFIQQSRWSLGAHEVIMRQFPRALWRLGPRRALHYALLMAYYPTAAIAWMLGVTSGIIYLTLGTSSIAVSPQLWLILYCDAAALQVLLYFWNRRHNVSPHEGAGSSGVAGMFISALTVPIYVSALFAALLRRRAAFVVTPKGDAASRDNLGTFRRHLYWAVPIVAAFVVAVLHKHTNPWMYVWSVLSLLVCVLPIVIWSAERLKARATRPVAENSPTSLRAHRTRHAAETGRLLLGGSESA